jgi:hypothetical protein
LWPPKNYIVNNKNNKVQPSCIGKSLINRSRMVTSLMNQLVVQIEADKTLKKQLIEAAPETLREWLVEDLILENLFEFGIASRKIVFNKDYDFGNLSDVTKKMKQLGKAWDKVITIVVDNEPEPHRVQVKIKVLL